MNIQLEKAAYTVSEFLNVYGIGRTKFYDLVKKGRLPIKKVGKRSLIKKVDADAWLNSLPEASET